MNKNALVLVDTSVWVSHFRSGNSKLGSLLFDDKAACHPFIIGELSCGNIRNRDEILSLMRALPETAQVEHDEIMQFIEDNNLMGKGLGYIDVHLLASAVLSGVSIWTLDRRLKESALKLGLRAL